MPKRFLKRAWGDGIQQQPEQLAERSRCRPGPSRCDWCSSALRGPRGRCSPPLGRRAAVATAARALLPRPVRQLAGRGPADVQERRMTADAATASPPKPSLYLRVSTKEQAERGGESEGFSIPAQRQACLPQGRAARRAGRHGVRRRRGVRPLRRPAGTAEACSATSRTRASATSSCTRSTGWPATACDDVEINLAIQQGRRQLVSVTENIDETPSGMLLHGIMSSIAEFY